MKKFKEYINEDNDMSTYTIICRDRDKALWNLIDHIKNAGNIGHSFEIIVDPGDEREKKFYWDGDGSGFIKSLKES